jgi:ferric-dicitrate binding protein FerR (iron transport regulator)
MPTQDDPLPMDHLVIRSLQGRATSHEEAQVWEWRQEEPENERHYCMLEQLWSVTGAARPKVEASPIPDPDMLIQKAETWLHGRPSQAGGPVISRASPEEAGRHQELPAPWRTSKVVTTLKAAALAAAFIPVGFGLAHLFGPAAPIPGPLADSEITTGFGEMTTIELTDGTSIRLGPRSRLRLSHGSQGRIAHLDGRGFFGVQSDPGETFTVQTRHGSVFILGTRLEVRSEAEEFRVLVVDGSVRVAVGEASTDLLAGEMSQSLNGGPTAVFAVDDVYAHLDWMGNAMVFQATPLKKVISEIERRHGVEVLLESPGLAEFTVTAAFTGQEVGEVVAVICQIISARCSFENGRVHITE